MVGKASLSTFGRGEPLKGLSRQMPWLDLLEVDKWLVAGVGDTLEGTREIGKEHGAICQGESCMSLTINVCNFFFLSHG